MSTDCIDTEAREMIHELALKHEKLEGVVWGPDQKNGLRSKVAILEAWKGNACRELEEFKGHVAACDQAEEGGTEVKVAEIQAGGHVAAAKETARGQVLREWLVLGGIVVLAFRDVILPIVQGAPK